MLKLRFAWLLIRNVSQQHHNFTFFSRAAGNNNFALWALSLIINTQNSQRERERDRDRERESETESGERERKRVL